MMHPGSMPGATRARRRLRVTYELGTSGITKVVIGRPLVEDSEAATVYLRKGMLELRAEWPHTNDVAINAKFIVTSEFVDPFVPVSEVIGQ